MKSWSRVIAREKSRARRRMSRTDMCGLKYPKPFAFQRCAARWLTIRPPRKRYAKDIVTENWSKIYDDGSTRSRPSLIAVTRRGRPLANSNGWTKERERGKGRMENERKGEKDEYKFQLRDADETAGSIAHVYAMVINYLSRDVWQPANIFLTFQRFFVYLYVLGRTWLWAPSVALLYRPSLSILSFHYTVATVHPEFMALLEREDSRAFTVWIKRETNGRKINQASRD